MFKRKYTVRTQLHEVNNKDLIDYFEESRHGYAQAMRESFHVLKRSSSFNKSSYNTYLQGKYGITKRTANSLISDAQGRLNALRELKLYEKKQLESKINALETRVLPRLLQQRNDTSTLLRLGLPVSLEKQRNLRRKIVAKQNKLNRLKQTLGNLNYQLETNSLKLCFGTKKFLTTDYTSFVEQRDSQMSFIGTKSETRGNQMLQLTYNPKNNQFHVRLRKDFNGYKQSNGEDKYVYGKVYFNHHKDKLIHILKNKNSPLSFKIVKKSNRYYLYCTFEIQVVKEGFLTRSDYGTIGLDFNKGFVTISETDGYGNLVNIDFLTYRFKQGSKTKSDLERVVTTAVSYAQETGKDLCIENLNFNKKKAQTESKQGKKYNDMLHSFAYKLFSDLVEQVAFRNQVYVRKVNPAWTSYIAEHKYCSQMKLNIHIGASFVIARRGQGFKDII